MLLAAIPGEVGDGETRTVTNVVAGLGKHGHEKVTCVHGATSQAVTTFVGKDLGDRTLQRFLAGPKECEITGIAETPGRTLFINIQHPGETTVPDFATGAFGSHWPGGGVTRPRSATIAITRDDGGDVAIE